MEDWITTAEAVTVSGYHPERIRELVREGKVRGQKWGSQWQVSRSSLVAYVQAAQQAVDRRHGPRPKSSGTKHKSHKKNLQAAP